MSTPKTCNPMIPMVTMTGRPGAAQVDEYVQGLYDMGIQSFLMYGRDGCEMEYLTEEWFTACEHFIRSAEKRKMTVWLYDEFNWPSGQAGGKVQAISADYCLRCAQVEKDQIVVKVSHYPNLLSVEAMDHFVRLTHETYAARFGKWFGTTVVGIFTDEPSYGYGARTEDGIPWYEGIAEDYAQNYGRPLEPDMLENTPEFRSRYNKLLSDRFYTNYSKRLGDWCTAHGLMLTGHLLNDHAMLKGMSDGGNVLRQLSAYALPGIDEIRTKLLISFEMQLFSMAEYISRHSDHGAMAEIFAFGPIGMTFRRKRQAIYLAGLHGVDHYFLAVSHLDMRGNVKKSSFFMNHSPYNPDHKGYLLLKEDAIRAAALAQKPRYTPIRIRYAFTELSKELWQPGWEQLDDLYHELTNGLRDRQVGWALLNENEVPDETDTVVLGFRNGHLMDEATGQVFYSAEDAAAYAAATVPPVGKVYTDEGKLAKELFVRHFTDGTAAILDLTENTAPRTLVWVTEQESMPFVLPAGDLVYTAEMQPVRSVRPVEWQSMTLTTAKTQYFRQNFVGDIRKLSFRVSEKPVSATFYLRTFTSAICQKGNRDLTHISITMPVEPAPISALLDGKPIETTPGSDLVTGMKELYAQSRPILLEPGMHKVEITCQELDFKYLPAVLLAGDFKPDYATETLTPQPTTADPTQPMSFFGSGTLTGMMEVPADAVALRIETPRLTRLSLNGVAQNWGYGLREIAIPAALRGTSVQVTFDMRSDLTPLFGDFKTFGEMDPNDRQADFFSDWRGLPAVYSADWIVEV